MCALFVTFTNSLWKYLYLSELLSGWVLGEDCKSPIAGCVDHPPLVESEELTTCFWAMNIAFRCTHPHPEPLSPGGEGVTEGDGGGQSETQEWVYNGQPLRHCSQDTSDHQLRLRRGQGSQTPRTLLWTRPPIVDFIRVLIMYGRCERYAWMYTHSIPALQVHKGTTCSCLQLVHSQINANLSTMCITKV